MDNRRVDVAEVRVLDSQRHLFSNPSHDSLSGARWEFSWLSPIRLAKFVVSDDAWPEQPVDTPAKTASRVRW